MSVRVCLEDAFTLIDMVGVFYYYTSYVTNSFNFSKSITLIW